MDVVTTSDRPDLEDETRAAFANRWGVPMRWDGRFDDLPDGYDGALGGSVDGHEAGVVPNTLCLMAVAVVNEEIRRGLAGMAVSALRTRAADAGLDRVIAPVRPSLKPRYPLTDMEIFAAWTREDGLSIDPWIRTHQRLGATILGPARRSMAITGSVAEWETWTDMVFPQTGHYVVPDALGLVEIDREVDQGTYVEDNLWMQHV